MHCAATLGGSRLFDERIIHHLVRTICLLTQKLRLILRLVCGFLGFKCVLQRANVLRGLKSSSADDRARHPPRRERFLRLRSENGRRLQLAYGRSVTAAGGEGACVTLIRDRLTFLEHAREVFDVFLS